MREALRHLPLENQLSHSSHASHTSHPQPESKARSTPHPPTNNNTKQQERKHIMKLKVNWKELRASALGGDPPRTARRDRRRHCGLRERMLKPHAKRQDADDGRVCLRHSRHRRHNTVPPDRQQRRQRHERRRAVEPGGGGREVKDEG